MKNAISACLAGVNCRYNATSIVVEEYRTNEDDFLLICPEVSGGLPIPREPIELAGVIETNAYDDLVSGTIKAVDKFGNDYSKQFIEGCNLILEKILANYITEVILKQNSPSCGVTIIYDGTFTGKKIAGEGVLSALLRKNKIKVRHVE